jgi:hypothetical protein
MSSLRPPLAAAALLFALTVLGCGGDDGASTALEGIYELASWTHNPDGCDGEGPAAFEESNYSHFFIKREAFFGEEFVTTVFCSEIDECRAQAAEEDTLHIGNFAFDSGNDDDGWTGTSAILFNDDTSCMGSVLEATLTGTPESAVRIDEEGVTVTDVPLGADDSCDDEAAYEQAAGLPCEELTVVMGTYLEGI